MAKIRVALNETGDILDQVLRVIPDGYYAVIDNKGKRIRINDRFVAELEVDSRFICFDAYETEAGEHFLALLVSKNFATITPPQKVTPKVCWAVLDSWGTSLWYICGEAGYPSRDAAVAASFADGKNPGLHAIVCSYTDDGSDLIQEGMKAEEVYQMYGLNPQSKNYGPYYYQLTSQRPKSAQ